jgi:DNA-binding LytR/AlgR family response regulator
MQEMLERHACDKSRVCHPFLSADALIRYLRTYGADVIVIDAILGDKSGVEVVKEIHTIIPGAQIIFTSGDITLCSSVYAVEHVCFLPKPVNETTFAWALGVAEERARVQKMKTLSFKNREGIFKIPFEDILFLENNKRKLTVHTRSGAMETYASIESVSSDLDARFIHCHKSFIVNMDFVQSMQRKNFLLETGQTIPISQSRFANSRMVFLTHLGSV